MWLKISSAQTFSFSNSKVTTFPTSQKCKNFNFSLYTVPAEMLYLQKYLTNFQKLFFRWKKRKVAIVDRKFQLHRHFRLPMATLQLFQRSRKRKNFNFSLYTVPAEMLYLQKYLTNFQKHFFRSKKRTVAIVVENFKVHRHFRFAIETLQLFQHWKCKNLIFCLDRGPAEMLYLQRYLTNFQKLFLAERRGRSLLSLKISSAQTFSFPMATLQLYQHPKNVKISIFPFTLSGKKCYIYRGI